MDERYAKKIGEFYARAGRMPSFEEIRKLLGFASKNAVAKLVSRLESRGVLRQDTEGRLIPLLFGKELRVLGLVEAGFPTEAEEGVLDTISLDDFLIEKKEATFMLRVKGDSMKDAGIIEGDYVIVERTKDARPGSIVIAIIDGKYTMKYLRVRDGKSYLEAANTRYKPFFPEEELQIEAVVKSVVRKY